MKRQVLITAATYAVLALAGAMSFTMPQSLPIDRALPGKAALHHRGARVATSHERAAVVPAVPWPVEEAPVEFDASAAIASHDVNRCGSICRGWGVCAASAFAGRENDAPPPMPRSDPADK